MGVEARYSRFLLYKKRLSAGDVERLTSIDHHGHEALVALHAETGEPLGLARMLQQPQHPDTAEVAISVTDAWQGRAWAACCCSASWAGRGRRA
jgi:hypothetical protein